MADYRMNEHYKHRSQLCGTCNYMQGFIYAASCEIGTGFIKPKVSLMCKMNCAVVLLSFACQIVPLCCYHLTIKLCCCAVIICLSNCAVLLLSFACQIVPLCLYHLTIKLCCCAVIICLSNCAAVPLSFARQIVPLSFACQIVPLCCYHLPVKSSPLRISFNFILLTANLRVPQQVLSVPQQVLSVQQVFRLIFFIACLIFLHSPDAILT